MRPKPRPSRTGVAPLAGALLAGCTSLAGAPPADDAAFQALLAASFRSEGIATIDRLAQDADQRTCSAATPPSEAARRDIEARARAQIPAPADGRYLGDWREGEKLAQSGRGLTWVDKSAAPAANGGSCYNCHQITRTEIAHGTLGPSLLHYARLHGVTDPADPAAAAAVAYTWGKLHDAWASHACSAMPRFGRRGLLDEAQRRHLMALLLDPASPVNAD